MPSIRVCAAANKRERCTGSCDPVNIPHPTDAAVVHSHAELIGGASLLLCHVQTVTTIDVVAVLFVHHFAGGAHASLHPSPLRADAACVVHPGGDERDSIDVHNAGYIRSFR
jgi:hypothetical protein